MDHGWLGLDFSISGWLPLKSPPPFGNTKKRGACDQSSVHNHILPGELLVDNMHHFETVGAILFVKYFRRNQTLPGFLRWSDMDFVHPQYFTKKGKNHKKKQQKQECTS